MHVFDEQGFGLAQDDSTILKFWVKQSTIIIFMQSMLLYVHEIKPLDQTLE